MKILFLVIGKTDEAYLEQGIEKYMARLKHYASVEMKVIPACVIGAFTEKEFHLTDVNGKEIEFLPPQTDELYKM